MVEGVEGRVEAVSNRLMDLAGADAVVDEGEAAGFFVVEVVVVEGPGVQLMTRVGISPG